MKRLLVCSSLLFVFLCFLPRLLAQPAIEWDKSFGGNLEDELATTIQTSDGGYILGGYSRSAAGGDKSESSSYFGNAWVLKIDSAGTKEWDKTFRQSNDLFSIISVHEAGYMVGTRFGTTIRLIRIDNNGAIRWEKDINAGALGSVRPEDMTRTKDGGYVIVATASATAGNDKTETTKGLDDYWVIKIDSSGKILWDKTIGGSSFDIASSIKESSDGNYIIAGSSVSEISGDKSDNSFGDEQDYWIVKLDPDGEILWDKTIGGNGYDLCESIFPTTDGGYIVGGYSNSPASGDKTHSSTDSGYWIVKITADGGFEWDKSLSGAPYMDEYENFQRLSSIIQLRDGGYIAVGTSTLNSGYDKSEDSKGSSDIWVVKLATDGEKLWDKTIGGSGNDGAATIIQSRDGGQVISGWSFSLTSGDKTQDTFGENDYWLIKLAAEKPLPVALLSFSAKEEIQKTFLTWKTASETASEHFEIQHSMNGKLWNVIGTVKSKGESADIVNYQFVHTDPVGGVNNLYRLKMVDKDNTFTYSSIKAVKFKSIIEAVIYPNPASGILKMKGIEIQDIRAVVIFNSSGSIVYRSGPQVRGEIDLKGLSAGIYGVKIWRTDGSEMVKNIVVAGK